MSYWTRIIGVIETYQPIPTDVLGVPWSCGDNKDKINNCHPLPTGQEGSLKYKISREADYTDMWQTVFHGSLRGFGDNPDDLKSVVKYFKLITEDYQLYSGVISIEGYDKVIVIRYCYDKNEWVVVK